MYMTSQIKYFSQTRFVLWLYLRCYALLNLLPMRNLLIFVTKGHNYQIQNFLILKHKSCYLVFCEQLPRNLLVDSQLSYLWAIHRMTKVILEILFLGIHFRCLVYNVTVEDNDKSIFDLKF
jgi:hypothetical protein